MLQVEFAAEKLSNEYSYIGIDQIGLTDPLRGISMCTKQLENASQMRAIIRAEHESDASGELFNSNGLPLYISL